MIKLRFTFRVGSNPKNLRSVLADTYEQAAVIAAKKIYGAPQATRLYGMVGFSGYFQGTRTVFIRGRKQKQNVGAPFHLQMIWSAAHIAYELNGYTLEGDIATKR